jgi:hypothetical protein
MLVIYICVDYNTTMIPSYPKTPHWPESLSVHRGDHYHDNPEWFLGRPVVITEKLDGGVTGIRSSKVYARSSEKTASQPWFDYVKSRTVPKLHSVSDNLVVWGEDLYGVHSISYNPLPDSFFLFHILDRDPEFAETPDTHNDHFWAWDNVKTFARGYELQHVPVLFEGSFTQIDQITNWFMENITQPSMYGPVCEGFVLRVAEGFAFDSFAQNVAKFVRKGHVTTDQRWEYNWKPARIIQ